MQEESVNLSYSSVLGVMKNTYRNKKLLQSDVEKLNNKLAESQSLYVNMINAQKVLSAVSDENTNQVLNFVTGMVNKTLSEVFPHDSYSISISKKLFAGSKPHITIELKDANGYILDTTTQCGTGLIQIISFMYVICLVEIRKGRRLILLDERLNGLHMQAKKFMSHIIEIFVKGGFQFIFVEYSLNSIGKIYNVEKRGDLSQLIAIDGEYDDSCVYWGDVDLSVLDENYTEEE